MRFEDEADEESYQMLRNREKRAVVPRDYVEDYSSTTEYGDLIFHQRLYMVHWIVQVSSSHHLARFQSNLSFQLFIHNNLAFFLFCFVLFRIFITI